MIQLFYFFFGSFQLISDVRLYSYCFLAIIYLFDYGINFFFTVHIVS